MAAAVVSKTCTTSEKRLIAKISLTMGVRPAAARRPLVAFDCLEAIISARRPALDMYSTPEKSTRTVVAADPTQASNLALKCRARIVVDAPYGAEYYDLAFELLADFHRLPRSAATGPNSSSARRVILDVYSMVRKIVVPIASLN